APTSDSHRTWRPAARSSAIQPGPAAASTSSTSSRWYSRTRPPATGRSREPTAGSSSSAAAESAASAAGLVVGRIALGRCRENVGGVVVDQPPAVGSALEQIRREDRGDREASVDFREDVLRAGDPGQVAARAGANVREREPHLGGVLEDRRPRGAHGVPADQDGPTRVDTLHVLAVRPHELHPRQVERLERLVEARVRLLDRGEVAHPASTSAPRPAGPQPRDGLQRAQPASTGAPRPAGPPPRAGRARPLIARPAAGAPPACRRRAPAAAL